MILLAGCKYRDRMTTQINGLNQAVRNANECDSIDRKLLEGAPV